MVASILFSPLTLKNETTGDEWTHPIGQQDASALSQWFADQSDYQRQDLPYELEELASRIVASYADSENNTDQKLIRQATIQEIPDLSHQQKRNPGRRNRWPECPLHTPHRDPRRLTQLDPQPAQRLDHHHTGRTHLAPRSKRSRLDLHK